MGCTLRRGLPQGKQLLGVGIGRWHQSEKRVRVAPFCPSRATADDEVCACSGQPVKRGFGRGGRLVDPAGDLLQVDAGGLVIADEGRIVAQCDG